MCPEECESWVPRARSSGPHVVQKAQQGILAGEAGCEVESSEESLCDCSCLGGLSRSSSLPRVLRRRRIVSSVVVVAESSGGSDESDPLPVDF